MSSSRRHTDCMASPIQFPSVSGHTSRLSLHQNQLGAKVMPASVEPLEQDPTNSKPLGATTKVPAMVRAARIKFTSE